MPTQIVGHSLGYQEVIGDGTSLDSGAFSAFSFAEWEGAVRARWGEVVLAVGGVEDRVDALAE